jgi:dephospho-CoA kinase|tara:strand:+ start:411 stop:974 length:564 start_codon:yes stop_codon:yes gene_type:complete
MIIGITGSFGSGKTTVAEMFRKQGFKVINVDKLYHGIYKRNLILKFKIRKEFGTLDRNKIKEIVFDDSSKLRKLNKMTHPLILKSLKKEIKKIRNKKIIIDIPLLFEAEVEKLFDKIIVVKCSKKTQIERILKKKKHTKKEIKQIIKSQMPLKDKIKKANFVVDNGGTIYRTRNQVMKMLKTTTFKK